MDKQPTKLTVAFDINDQAYNIGMWFLLKDIFTEEMGISLHLIPLGLVQADIYIGRFAAGADTICRPEVLARKRNSLSIEVSDGNNPPKRACFSSCLAGSVVVRKVDAIQHVRDEIIAAWRSADMYSPKGCMSCRALHLSEIEAVVVDWVCRGLPANQIAEHTELTSKVVSGHRRAIIRKFNLSGVAELVAFMKRWRVNASPCAK